MIFFSHFKYKTYVKDSMLKNTPKKYIVYSEILAPPQH